MWIVESVYSVYLTLMKSKELISLLLREGWTPRGVRGSHHVYVHPNQPGHISVPLGNKDLGIGLLEKLLKQSGLKGR
jgi:predicted RNA binding protein YcfA (HicA-like mRNA interferase family)